MRAACIRPKGSWNPEHGNYVPVRDLPVYARQYFPESVLGSQAPGNKTPARPCTKTPPSACGRLDDEC
jgi:3-hydroxyacyl-CoA dehydrogenase